MSQHEQIVWMSSPSNVVRPATSCALRRSPPYGSDPEGLIECAVLPAWNSESTLDLKASPLFGAYLGWPHPLLLDEIHYRHDDGWLRQLDSQLLHDRPEVRKERIESLLALPDIEDLKLPIFTEACVKLHGALGCPGLTKTLAPLGVQLNGHILGDDVDRNHE